MNKFDNKKLYKLAPKILLGFLGTSVVLIKPCLAQSNIVKDDTLGSEASKITPNVDVDGIPSELIEGGAERGQNLFHSLQKFNVGEGRGAYFVVPSDKIQNVLTRVTGNNLSNILGTLGIRQRVGGDFVGSEANLFLINPNGILFGENARLDVGGSFVGTTANGVQFGERGVFSATNPQAPSKLLTVNPSAFLFSQINQTASIENSSVADSGRNPSDTFTSRGLRVPDGKSLLLVGGNVNIVDGGLYAYGGRVELGGLTDKGIVWLNGDGSNLSLSFSDKVNKSDILLSDGAIVNVRASNGGNITVTARNLNITEESFLVAGIEPELSSNNSKAGNIEVKVAGRLNLNNRSSIRNQVRSGASGQGGNVSIIASILRLESGAQISTNTSGEGKAGNLTVNAQDIQVIGKNKYSKSPSSLFSRVHKNSTGDSGDLIIKTDTLLVKDGAEVGVSTFSQGKAGNLTIDSQDIQVIGANKNGRSLSKLLTSTQRKSTGNAGNLKIKTNTLLVKDGAQVSAGTFGKGKGGNLTVTAQEVRLISKSQKSRYASGLYTSAQRSSTGDAGDLTINTNILRVKDGAQINTDTFSKGKGGNLIIDAQDVQLIGESKDGQFASGLSTSALSNATGDAGNLKIKTNTLLVKDGAQVSATTHSKGKGGSLNITAQNIKIIGRRKNGQFASGLLTSTQTNSTGNAGDLNITTNTLLIKDGALVNSGTFGLGKGGNLSIDAQNVQVIGESKDAQFPSGLSTAALLDLTGDAGDLKIRTNTLLVKDGGVVGTGTVGNGKGGNLTIEAQDVQLIGRSTDSPFPSGLATSTQQNSTGDAGDLNIKTNNFLLRDGSEVSTSTFGKGKGANLTIHADTLQVKDGIITARSEGSGKAGEININVKDNFNADKGQIITQSQQSSGGNINITAGKNILLRNNSNIKTILSTTDKKSGDINFKANAIVALGDSDILAFAPEGTGGNINFDTDAFLSDSLYRPRPQNAVPLTAEELNQLDDNNRVDVDATGSISSGTISGQTDPSFLQNSLTELPQNQIDSKALIATSCVVRSKERNGTFFITGKTNLPYSPEDAVPSNYSAIKVQPLPDDTSAKKPRRRWKMGDPIVEPSGVYRLENGRRVLSRECSK